ncbi:FAD-dependent oxidoreductase [Halodesulfovibrio marinisediminis]|uniref:Thioredoxin reductase (NADPH) n=1 Tax=Halodesulfovibrio marinisediminis DSM 17456 TaxID=1121457 RepID=A0A1N6J374_9BACT|nr:FAD-dependent oxidoreductase [Halodesulfovibrio marinisediminis]SIO38717.1 thioredoxin reductase (NADPH) [Halodesulfovibrio marinisediminis DSM 17456]
MVPPTSPDDFSSTQNTPSPHDEDRWLLPQEARASLSEIFQKLKNTVELHVVTDTNPQNMFNDITLQFARDISRLSEQITFVQHTLGDDFSQKHDVQHSPSMLFNPEEFDIRFTGAPLGEEGKAFVEAILHISFGVSALSETSKTILAELSEPRHIRVFSSPGCPYCPEQFMNAVKATIEQPKLIRAECIDSDEFPDLTKQFNVGSVPHTVFSDQYSRVGLLPQERFCLELLMLRDAEEVLREQTQVAKPEEEEGKVYDLLILGAGPAGLTAAIYAKRSGLDAIVLDNSMIGGQVLTTPVVENYPGFKSVGGTALVEILTAHTREYSNIRENQSIEDVIIGDIIQVHTPERMYETKALIFATGTKWRPLGVEGEMKYFGTGVSHCASCDGYMFRGKHVVMVGGGNSALTDALHLKNLGIDVVIIHRRDTLRAEKALQDALKRERIPAIYDTVVEEVYGNDTEVEGVTLKNTKTGEITKHPCNGVFIAIGMNPNSQLAEKIGTTLNPDKTIHVDAAMRTNIPRVYAAGDVNGGVRQIVTAVSDGAVAAMSAFEDLQHPYWASEKEDQTD